MQRQVLLVPVLIFSSLLCFAQPNKFSHSLAEYNISLQVDTAAWRRVTYAEMATIYRRHKADFDDFLQAQKAIALFIFVPKDSTTINDQTSITVTIDSLRGSTGYVQTVRDTIESSAIRLQNLQGGMNDKPDHGSPYFDKTTNSLISKHSVIIVKRGEGISENNKVGYLVVQQKEVGRKRIMIEYRCFTSDEAHYFPLFEKIIPSFR
ncbi:MAG: hypothetical protein ABW019_17280 [Chitinophagaceae bacterium]